MHCIEPRASHSKGGASSTAEFNFERRDASLDVRPVTSCCMLVLGGAFHKLHGMLGTGCWVALQQHTHRACANGEGGVQWRCAP